MPKLTSKQEAFAREVAKGKSLSEAYRTVYSAEKMRPATIHVESCKLAAHPKVSQMVERLRGEMDRVTVVSVTSDRERILSRLRALLDSPEGTAAENISLKAAHLLGQTLGLYEKRVTMDDRREDRTPEQIRAELEQRIAIFAGESGTQH